MIRSVAVALVLGVSSAYAAGNPGEFWTGHAERNGAKLPIQVRLNGDKTGAFDIPDSARLGIPLATEDRSGARLTLGFGSARYDHLLEGKVQGNRFEGTWHWTDAKIDCHFVLEKSADTRPYTMEEVTFKNGDVTLSGTVLAPKSPGPHPGIVMVDGSGDAVRWFREGHADFFARRGMVALIYDKRGCGKSTGNWRLVNFESLAGDALAALHVLQARKDVDPKRCGFWGISQAGWIMPLAAHKEPENVAFIVAASGPSVNVKDEGKYDYIVRLRDAGVSAEDIALADKILELDHQVTMTGQGYDELRKLVTEARAKPWWKTMDFELIPVGARAFPKLIGGYDPRPVLDEIKTPILWMYGSADKSVEPSKNIAILNDIMAKQPKPWTIRTFENADHGLQLPRDPAAAFPLRQYAPGYWDTMGDWLKSQGD